MNNLQQKALHRELKGAGASSRESQELAGIASRLGVLKNSDVPQATGSRPRKKLRLALIIGIPAVTGLALGMFLVVVSQTVLPGSTLYPIQAGSDSLAAAVSPSYRGTVMMKRAEQVKQLIHNGAPADKVLATLADYEKQAASYKSAASNYAAFEYCKNNLQQAAQQATNSERQAITKALVSLSAV